MQKTHFWDYYSNFFKHNPRVRQFLFDLIYVLMLISVSMILAVLASNAKFFKFSINQEQQNPVQNIRILEDIKMN